jgi:hypothetical protein
LDPVTKKKADLISAGADWTNLLPFIERQEFNEIITLNSSDPNNAAIANKTTIGDILDKYIPKRAAQVNQLTRVLVLIQGPELIEAVGRAYDVCELVGVV